VRERSAEEGDEEGAFELPCLERATEVSLDLGFLGLTVPPAGVFSRLTEFFLAGVRLHCPGLLGDAVSWPRCPCLQKLTVRDARGLDNLAIHSNSLRQVELADLQGLRQLNIVAPALEELKVARCFFGNRSQPVASITAPQLATLQWTDPYDPSSVHLGEMKHLRLLRPFFFSVYVPDSFPYNQSCLSLLRRFKVIECLILALVYMWVSSVPLLHEFSVPVCFPCLCADLKTKASMQSELCPKALMQLTPAQYSYMDKEDKIG
jgi:hypothetical protein